MTQTALVTGASQGLGRSLMTLLVQRGWRVAGVARTASRLQDAVTATGAPDRALALPGDVSHPHDLARIVGEATGRLGPIDLLIHAASTLGPTPLRPLLELSDDAFDDVMAVNLAGPFRLTRRVAGAMALRGGGTVVFVSSDAAVEAYPTWGAYGASKAALDHLTRTFAAELPEVRFVAVDPGEMDTAMHADAMPDADRSTLAHPDRVAEALWNRLAEVASGTRFVVEAA